MIEHVKIFLHGLVVSVFFAIAVLFAVVYWRIVGGTVLVALLLISIYMVGRSMRGKPGVKDGR